MGESIPLSTTISINLLLRCIASSASFSSGRRPSCWQDSKQCSLCQRGMLPQRPQPTTKSSTVSCIVHVRYEHYIIQVRYFDKTRALEVKYFPSIKIRENRDFRPLCAVPKAVGDIRRKLNVVYQTPSESEAESGKVDHEYKRASSSKICAQQSTQQARACISGLKLKELVSHLRGFTHTALQSGIPNKPKEEGRCAACAQCSFLTTFSPF